MRYIGLFAPTWPGCGELICRIEDESVTLLVLNIGHRSNAQAWFWSKEWQQGEREVQQELKKKGPGKAYTAKELLQEIADA